MEGKGPGMSQPPIFVSYSRHDADFALRLGRDLRAAGVNLWIDQLVFETPSDDYPNLAPGLVVVALGPYPLDGSGGPRAKHGG